MSKYFLKVLYSSLLLLIDFPIVIIGYIFINIKFFCDFLNFLFYLLDLMFPVFMKYEIRRDDSEPEFLIEVNGWEVIIHCS